MARFEGRRVIVTGAGSGFGTAIAQRFAAEGAAVVVADIDITAAEKVAADLPPAVAVRVDVTQDADNAAMAATAVDAFGGIDVVCANAGGAHRLANLVDLPVEDFDRMFALNVRSVYLAIKHCVPHMGEGSSIVATASIGGRRPRPALTAYNASKGAVITLVRGVATELAPRIRVNAVCPVSSDTGFDQHVFGTDMPAEFEANVVKGIPMGRRAMPDDVAGSVLFLASDDASFLTGVCLDVDGGRSIA
ncbi:MAG: glucose 1-dehydrogenase [Acidimicrobiia bacterium]